MKKLFIVLCVGLRGFCGFDGYCGSLPADDGEFIVQPNPRTEHFGSVYIEKNNLEDQPRPVENDYDLTLECEVMSVDYVWTNRSGITFKYDKQSLENLFKQPNPVPVLINHDWNRQVGQVLNFKPYDDKIKAIIKVNQTKLFEYAIEGKADHVSKCGLSQEDLVNLILMYTGVSHQMHRTLQPDGTQVITNMRELTLCINQEPFYSPSIGSIRIIPDDAPST